MVPGHEGAGVVEAAGRRRRRSGGGRSCGAVVGAVLRSLPGVPARPAASVLDGLAQDAHRWPAGRHHPASVRRSGGASLLLPLGVRRERGGARAVVHPDPRRCPVRGWRAARLRGHQRSGCGVAHRRGAAGRPGRGGRTRRHGTGGGDGRGRGGRGPRDRGGRVASTGWRGRSSSGATAAILLGDDPDRTADEVGASQRRRRRLRVRDDRPVGGDPNGVSLDAAARRHRAAGDPARRRRAGAAGAVDPADGAADPGVDLRLRPRPIATSR